jgi:hypothetical protein
MATITKGKTFVNGELVTPANLHQMVDAATVANIVNADIASNAAIADTKLATISTANKVAQSAVANLTTDLAGKAASSHTHTIANVTGLQTALDGKQASGSYAPATGIAPSAITGTAVVTSDPRLSDARTAVAHTHDDRYYTESEMNTLLAGKQASGSYAPATGIAPSAITGTAVITTDSRLSDARTPTTHTHDDRYYTETEVNSLLAGKQASGSYAAATHTHSANDITSGTLANARTTATSSNLINTIVARNNFGGIDIALITGVSPGPSSGIYNINTSTGTYIGGILTNSTNTGVIYSTSSDHRLKTDLEKLTGALDRLSALPVHRFKWVGHPAAPKVDGFLAHEAQAVVPEAVTGTKDAVDADGKPIHQGIDQSKLVPLLVAAVQELAARVAALEAK